MIERIKIAWDKLTKPTVVVINQQLGTETEAALVPDTEQGDLKLLAFPFEVMRLHNGEWHWADNRSVAEGDVVSTLNIMKQINHQITWPKQLVNVKLSHGDVKVHPDALAYVSQVHGDDAAMIEAFMAKAVPKLAEGIVPSILPVLFDCPPGTIMTGTYLREVM